MKINLYEDRYRLQKEHSSCETTVIVIYYGQSIELSVAAVNSWYNS